MIDLHIHTKYSDGTDNVIELLKKCEEINLKVISITDHNSCKAYFDLKNLDVKKYYSGKIICGCEFTINYEGNMIELLGYGFNLNKVNEYLNSMYDKKTINKQSKIIYNRLINKINDLNLKFNEKNVIITEEEFDKEMLGWKVWAELKKYKENEFILNENILSNYKNFFRNGLTNSNSKIFIDYLEFKPNIIEIIELIHRNGGKVFLAHPFQYQFCDPKKLIDDISNKYDIDGIECYHTEFTPENTNWLLDFCNKRNLLISGGSDYHGNNKENHNLGTGNSNLNISKEIINNWEIKFICEK